MNLVFGIFYFLFLFNEIFSEDKEIKQINLNYNQNNDNLIETNVIINSEIYILPIDINSDKTWINKTNNFNLKKEKPFIENKCNIKEYIEKEDKIIFNQGNIKLNSIFYLEIKNNENCNYKGILGLRDKNKKYSIIDSFKDTFKITKTFSLNKINNNIIEMKIGNHLDFIKNNIEKTINCNLLNDDKIVTNLQGIIIGDLDMKKKQNKIFYIDSTDEKLNIINEKIYFESIQKFIFGNNKFIKFLKDNTFYYSIKNGICKYEKKTNFYGFFCNKKILNNFPKISFIINDFLIKFNPINLFEQINDNNYIFIIINNENDNNKDWSFGHILLNKFNNIIFDNEKIYLIGKENIEKIRIIEPFDPYYESKSNFKYLITFYFFICMNLTGIIILLISLFKLKIIIEPKI